MDPIDEQIRKAIEQGKFDNLPGKGQRLNLDDNPYEDPAWRTAHHMLRNAGFSPAWIEKGQEIEADLGRARLEIRRAWLTRAETTHPARAAEEWRRAQARFSETLEELNRRIRSYNLEVPNAAFQKRPLSLERELETARRPAD